MHNCQCYRQCHCQYQMCAPYYLIVLPNLVSGMAIEASGKMEKKRAMDLGRSGCTTRSIHWNAFDMPV